MEIISEAEILSENHRLITIINIVDIDENNKDLYTLVPRNPYGRPIPFAHNKLFNIVLNSDGYITFMQVAFNKIAEYNGMVCYNFDIQNSNTIRNIRKEKRNNVEVEAVLSNFDKVWIVTVLDLSESGLRVESPEPITSEFVELIFDDANTERRASGQVVWEKQDENGNHIYGVNLNYR